MVNMRKNARGLVLGPRTGRFRRLAARLSKLVLDRAVLKAVQSLDRKPPQHACLLRNIGLSPGDSERLASELHVLAADPYRISLKPNTSSPKPKPRSR